MQPEPPEEPGSQTPGVRTAGLHVRWGTRVVSSCPVRGDLLRQLRETNPVFQMRPRGWESSAFHPGRAGGEQGLAPGRRLPGAGCGEDPAHPWARMEPWAPSLLLAGVPGCRPGGRCPSLKPKPFPRRRRPCWSCPRNVSVCAPVAVPRLRWSPAPPAWVHPGHVLPEGSLVEGS